MGLWLGLGVDLPEPDLSPDLSQLQISGPGSTGASAFAWHGGCGEGGGAAGSGALRRGNSRLGSRRRAAFSRRSALAAASEALASCFSGVGTGVDAGVIAASTIAWILLGICRASSSDEVTLAMSSRRLTPQRVRSASTWSGLSPAVLTRICCRRLVRRARAWFCPHALLPAARFEKDAAMTLERTTQNRGDRQHGARGGEG